MISAQTLRVCREGKPVSTFPDHALALRKLDGGDRPLPIVAPDRDSKPVQFVKPHVFDRPGLSVGEDNRLADKLGLSLLECAEDRRRAKLYKGHVVSGGRQESLGEVFALKGAQVVTENGF